MEFPLISSAIFLLSSVFYSLFGFYPVISQDMRERDAFCNAEGCFVIYFERKSFLDSWRYCKEKHGNLATIKRKEDASAIATLFSTVDLRGFTKVQIWIGLQRQPRQCSSHSLRGFSWTTGDQDTAYTNWQREDPPSMCLVPRCVSISYNILESSDNFKWIDGPCSFSVDGYLCHYHYKGMCSTLSSKGSGNILYTTPFNLLTTILTHIPVGSTANIQCPKNANENEPVQCMLKNDGSVAWSHESPFCSIPSISHQLCQQDNGGCEQFCRQAGDQIFCDCSEGFHLRYDRQTCAADVCQGDPCEFECLLLSDGYRCACPHGYMLASDNHACLDVDECLQSPCEQHCKNLPGTFECQCQEGYLLNEAGVCEDIDECLHQICNHSCENSPGSFTCHCHLGFSVDSEDLMRCEDDDECQIPGTCEQMCVNYEGGFQCFCKEGYVLSSDHSTCQKIWDGQLESATLPFPDVQEPEHVWDPVIHPWTQEPSSNRWPVNQERPLDWLTHPSAISNPEVIWGTSGSKDELHSVTQGPEEEREKLDALNWEQRSQLEVNVLTTTTQTILFPSTSTVSEWYDDHKEDSATTIPFLSSSTVAGGAWNWWPGFSTFTQTLENPTVPHTISDIKKKEEQEKYSPHDYLQLPGQDSGKEGNNYVENTHSQDPAVLTPKPLPPFLDEVGGSGDNLDSVQEDKEHKHSNIGLLVGLLVPIGIFIVVMVTLGIFYCANSGVKPRDKNAAECYHWISGAHDKQGAATGDKTPV